MVMRTRNLPIHTTGSAPIRWAATSGPVCGKAPRVSLGIAVVAAAINMTIGMCYGLISGYFGGWVDTIMQRIVEINNGIPRLVV